MLSSRVNADFKCCLFCGLLFPYRDSSDAKAICSCHLFSTSIISAIFSFFRVSVHAPNTVLSFAYIFLMSNDTFFFHLFSPCVSTGQQTRRLIPLIYVFPLCVSLGRQTASNLLHPSFSCQFREQASDALFSSRTGGGGTARFYPVKREAEEEERRSSRRPRCTVVWGSFSIPLSRELGLCVALSRC